MLFLCFDIFFKRPSFGGPAATMAVDPVQSEGVDSDCFSSNSSFLANEKLMSVDSLSSNETGRTLFNYQFSAIFLVFLFYAPFKS